MCHITEAELALFLLSCMQNRFFSPEKACFSEDVSSGSLVHNKENEGLQDPSNSL
jgi:hypothetical protein